MQFDADALDLLVPPLPQQPFLAGIAPDRERHGGRVDDRAPVTASYRSSSSQPDASSSRLTIDLMPSTTDLAGAAAAAAPPPAAPPPVDLGRPCPPRQPTGVRTVVIDPGHGGDELGAQGPRGTLEKEITLSVSRRLRTLIESRLGMRVFLTREDDRTISHDDRSAFANNHQADVFLSIHANAAVRPHVKGAEVYYLSVERADAEARKRAEDAAVVLPALGGGTRAIDLILWETAQARYLEQSAALAAAVEDRPAGASRDEPARGAAGAVPRAGRRQHAGRPGGDRLRLQPRSGAAARRRPTIRPRWPRRCSTRIIKFRAQLERTAP